MESSIESTVSGTKGENDAPRARGRSGQQSEPPLYLQVARTLKDEILSGVYPVGSKIPTEEELSQHFSVSRYTVREALRLLREDGLIASRQGAGTVVIPSRAGGSDLHQVMSINDIAAFGTDTRLAIESIRMELIDDKLASRTGLPSGDEWLAVRGYRHAVDAEHPLCLAEYYINRAFAAVGRLLQRNNGPIFQLIEDMFGQNIVEVQQQISATLISPAQANGLKVEPGSAALEVRRSYITADGTVAQVTINTHPASRFQHSMTLRRVRA